MPKHLHARVWFTQDIADAILDRVAAGEPLLRICGPSRAAGMPDRQTVYAWMRKDEGLYWAFMRARRLGAVAIGEEILEIADGRGPPCDADDQDIRAFGRQKRGTMPMRATAEQRSLGRDWLRVTARHWLAGVMAPRAPAAAAWREELMAERSAGQESQRGVEQQAFRAARIAGLLESARRRMVELEEGAAAGNPQAVEDLAAFRAGAARGLASFEE